MCHHCWHYWKKYGGLKAETTEADVPADSKKKLDAKVAIPAQIVNIPAAITPVPTVATIQPLALTNDIDLTQCDNNVTELSSRITHKCSIVNCDKEFKLKVHLARHYAQVHSIAIRAGSPRPIMKTRTAFYLQTNGMTKLSRRLCRHIVQSKKAARQPSYGINYLAVKMECKWCTFVVFLKTFFLVEIPIFNLFFFVFFLSIQQIRKQLMANHSKRLANTWCTVRRTEAA